MKLPSKRLLILALLIGVYLLQVLTIPQSYSRLGSFGLSGDRYQIFAGLVVLFYIVTWVVAYYGFIQLKGYASRIQQEADGKPLNHISDGLLALAAYFPLTAVVTNYTSYFTDQQPEWAGILALLNQYTFLIILFGGTYLLYIGSSRLIHVTEKQIYTSLQRIITVVALAFGTALTYILIAGPLMSISQSSTALSPPLWFLIATVALPYIYVFFMGTKTLHNIIFYSNNVRGILYKRAFTYITLGITMILLSILIRRLSVWSSSYVEYPSDSMLLLIVYSTLFVVGCGFVLIATGVRRLIKIEEA